jgi:hypothetical protein
MRVGLYQRNSRRNVCWQSQAASFGKKTSLLENFLRGNGLRSEDGWQ